MRKTAFLLCFAFVAGAAHAGKEMTYPLPGGESMEMVWVNAGTFMMGSPEHQKYAMRDELPQHEVTITRGFYIGKYEITQQQWERVMGTTPWTKQSYVKADPRHPAVYVTWYGVREFAERLNEFEGREVYRLPTEAEWEYAARAGTATLWSFGDDESQLMDYAWLRHNTYFAGLAFAQPVGLKKPNPWGLYDMHGNVWEWVEDWLGRYKSTAQIDPRGPDTGTYKVVRSGIFMADAQGVRSAFRYAGSPDFPDGGVGARLVRQEASTAVEERSWGRVKTGED